MMKHPLSRRALMLAERLMLAALANATEIKGNPAF